MRPLALRYGSAKCTVKNGAQICARFERPQWAAAPFAKARRE
jgi:hypothetical protein